MIRWYRIDGFISLHFPIAFQEMGMAANLTRCMCVNLASSKSSFMDDIEKSTYISVFALWIIAMWSTLPLWNWGWYPGDVAFVLHEAGERLERDAKEVAWAHLFCPSQDSFSMKMFHFTDRSHLTCLLAALLRSQAAPEALSSPGAARVWAWSHTLCTAPCCLWAQHTQWPFPLSKGLLYPL